MIFPLKNIVTLSVALALVITGQGHLQAKEIKNTRGEVITLDPTVKPSENFDLTDWSISLPVDTNEDGIADNVPESYLAKGLEVKPLFYTAEDGGMVFTALVEGPKTSKNTTYTRSELREMLRAGDMRVKVTGITENNWVFSTAKRKNRKKAGAVDGVLEATLAVNHVTTTGNEKQLGRVVIGQIHATKDEPIRVYYRKLPGNTNGSIYMAHEPVKGHGDEQWYDLIGSRSDKAEDNPDGVALGEIFSYRIEAKGNLLTLTIIRDGKPNVVQEVDMSESGYDGSDQYMYFKAGVYNQNKTGDANDYVQATFYQLENSH
ncbi:polysaccharide lyase family 7 protein [Colwellia echini]|uniref:Polysaccharide lyase family 7 protein n=1 Tax=Colwellia echini TaxID=1982103 RepID=A0ABY3MTK2_9GAMM|nr:polysaccharide lyase family 7 protein [Colwellia echini]TYK64515.1 polysaccharide lyase family 7 protein [Colwellia echini]